MRSSPAVIGTAHACSSIARYNTLTISWTPPQSSNGHQTKSDEQRIGDNCCHVLSVDSVQNVLAQRDWTEKVHNACGFRETLVVPPLLETPTRLRLAFGLV